MLLLLFNGGSGIPIPDVPDLSTLVTTAPTAGFGYPFQRPATAGVWRFVLELADPAAESLVWHDITEFYAGDRHQFGADDPFGRNRARVISVELQTDDDSLAPWGQDTSDLFGVNVQLDAGLLMRLSLIRVVSGVVEEWEPVWTGRVESWGDASAARGQKRTHIISVTDTIADLANVPVLVGANYFPWDTWFTEAVLPGGGWSFGVDIYGDTDSSGLPVIETPTAAATLMDSGTDPLGLTWRSLRNGKMVIHPWPWDTVNVDRYDNPLLDVYPEGLHFAYSPDITEIEYIADDDQEPFGVSRNKLGVLNWFAISPPDVDTVYLDDPVSVGHYGVRPYSASWIVGGPVGVLEDMLANRAYASVQALPLRVTLDHEGFWSALAIVDHLDPVRVVHQTSTTGLVVTVDGWIRNVVEERTWRGDGLLSWQSTVQIDVAETGTSEALLPVESLAFVGASVEAGQGPASAEFSWINPTQPSITPTHVQYRVIGSFRSFIWVDTDYPGVGADGQIVNWLEAGTFYRFEVRLVRKVNGVITNVSPIRFVRFPTPVNIIPYPTPGTDPGDTDVIGTPPDDECEDFQVDLQENDGTGWTTVDTFTLDDGELTPNGDGTYSLTTPIPNSFFNEGSVYRFRSSCDGVTWLTGPSFDPPDDWEDPCTEPPALSAEPFDDPSLLVYVPKICAPDIIREAVSGIEAVKGDAYSEILALVGEDPNQRALLAIGQPEWDDTPGGIVAYGECPQIVGETGDKTITCRVSIADDTVDCVLFECAGMTLKSVAVSGGGWRAVVTVYTPGTTTTVPSSAVLDPDTVYTLSATFELATGTIKLYVDGALENTVGGTDDVGTINALPIWRVGAPPDSWITDAALFNALLEVGLPAWDYDWDFSDASSITVDGSNRPQTITDQVAGNVASRVAPNQLSSYPAGTQNGLNYIANTVAQFRTQTLALTQPFTFQWVVWLGSGGTTNFGWSATGAVQTAIAAEVPSGGSATLICQANTSLTDAGNPLDTWMVVTMEYNGASSAIYVNQTQVTTGNAGTNGATQLDLFNSHDGSQTNQSERIGQMRFRNGILSSSARTSAIDEMMTKWGI